MKKPTLGIAVLSILLLLVGLVTSARAESDLDFALVNKTGYDLKEVYIGPTSSDEWGDNILKAILKDGQTLNVSFSPKLSAAKWDIKVVYEVDDTSAEWKGYKLKDITKITLRYDKDTDKTTAQTE